MAAPELAALALLDRALAVTEHALLAEHSALAGECSSSPPAVDATPRDCARRLIANIRPLRREIAHYRRAVCDQLVVDAEDELPF